VCVRIVLVRLYVCPHGTTLLPVDGYLLSWTFEDVSKSVHKIELSLKFDKNNGTFVSRPLHMCDNISLNSP